MQLHVTVMQKKKKSFPFQVQSAIKIHSCSTHLPLTCPCALVTSWPVTPWRLERALPKACELAMEPMAAAAAAAAAWLASGLLTSCKERKDQGETTERGTGTAHGYNIHWGQEVLSTVGSCKGPRTHWRGPSEHSLWSCKVWRRLDWGWKENILHQHWAT